MLFNEVSMIEKKRITPQEFYERMKAMRERPHNPDLIEKFNKIVELDEKHEREQEQKKQPKKIAHPPEADI